MGFKTFTAGAVLTAADVMTYLMDQAVITCTSGTRPASPTTGMTVYETDTTNFNVWTGAAWALVMSRGAWTGYTPTVSGMVVGNGTLTAAFLQVGKRVDLHISFTLGSTSSVAGGGSNLFSLPVNPLSPQAVAAACYDSSATTLFAAAAGPGLGGAGNMTVAITTTTPFTWATGDILLITGSYETV